MNEDEEIGLSKETQAALVDFLHQQQLQKDTFEATHEEDLRIEDFQEDWQMSQFWYDEPTCIRLANELLDQANENTRIAILSAPSVFIQLRQMCPKEMMARIFLFEFDVRFHVFGENFHRYDYNTPLSLPTDLANTFTRLLIDPPFLQEECQVKTAMTARMLSAQPERLLICTGERMSALVERVYTGVHQTSFLPKHKGGLANEFRCYANYAMEGQLA